MAEEAIDRLVGVTAHERADRYPNVRIFNHHWSQPEMLQTIGVISREEAECLTRRFVGRGGARYAQPADLRVRPVDDLRAGLSSRGGGLFRWGKVSLSWNCRAGDYQLYALVRSARDKHAHDRYQGYASAARHRASSGVCDPSFAVHGAGPACAGRAATRAPTPLTTTPAPTTCAGRAATRAPTPLTTTPAPTEPNTLPISMGPLHWIAR